MYKALSITIITLASFLLGYFSYPIFHEINETTDTPDTLSAQKQLEATDSFTKSIVKVREFNNVDEAVKNNISEEQFETSISDSPVTEGRDQILLESVDEIQNQSYQDMVNWQSEHKQNISETINANVPDSISQKMINKVTANNALLDDIEKQLASAKDEVWSYEMQQRINDLIQTNELSNRIEVFSLICKQSTCEIIGKGVQSGVWQQLNISIITSLFQEGLELDLKASKNVTYMEGTQEYFYSQFVFI